MPQDNKHILSQSIIKCWNNCCRSYSTIMLHAAFVSFVKRGVFAFVNSCVKTEAKTSNICLTTVSSPLCDRFHELPVISVLIWISFPSADNNFVSVMPYINTGASCVVQSQQFTAAIIGFPIRPTPGREGSILSSSYYRSTNIPAMRNPTHFS